MFSNDGATEWNDRDVLGWRDEAAKVPALTAERDALRAQYTELACAVGIAYEADGVAPAPGPHERVLEEVVRNRRKAEQLRDAHNDAYARGAEEARANTYDQVPRLRARVAELEAELARRPPPGAP